jgi:hypothetical protein
VSDKKIRSVKIAFFKGYKRKYLHRFIRWWTKSNYSHAELVMPDDETWIGISPFLGSRVAARKKTLDENEDVWDFLTFNLSWRAPVREYQLTQLQKFIDKTSGSKYDWTGVIISNLTSFLVKKRDRWYCSEWIAHALVNSRIVMWDDINLFDTPDLNPGKLYELLSTHPDCEENQ